MAARVPSVRGVRAGGSVASTDVNHSTPVLVAAAASTGWETLHRTQRCVELEQHEARTLPYTLEADHTTRAEQPCAALGTAVQPRMGQRRPTTA